MDNAMILASGMVALGLIGGWLAGTYRQVTRSNLTQQVKQYE